MKKNTTKPIWHKLEKEAPTKSTMTVVETTTGNIMTLPYSKKHKMFNVDDWNTEFDTDMTADVVYWTYAKDLKNEIRNQIKTTEETTKEI